MADRKIVLIELDPNEKGYKKLLAADPKMGIGSPTARILPVLPPSGVEGELVLDTSSSQASVWDGNRWVNLVGSNIETFANDQSVVTTARPQGTIGLAVDTGNMYTVDSSGAWKTVGVQAFNTEANLRSQSLSDGSIAVALDTQNVLFRDNGAWRMLNVKRFATQNALLSGTPDGAVLGYATDTGNIYSYDIANARWVPMRIAQYATQSNLLTTTAPAGELALAADTKNIFYQDGTQWHGLGIRRYDTAAQLLADTAAAENTLAVAHDSHDLYRKTATGWEPILRTSYTTEAALLADSPSFSIFGHATDTDHLFYYNGSAWQTVGIMDVPDIAALQGLTTLSRGSMVFVQATKQDYYYDGTNWRAASDLIAPNDAALLAIDPATATSAKSSASGNTFISDGTQWIRTGYIHYDNATQRTSDTATVRDGALAVDEDTRRIFLNMAGTWIHYDPVTYYADDAERTGDTVQTAVGHLSYTEAEGNTYISTPAGWRNFGFRTYPTAADRVADTNAINGNVAIDVDTDRVFVRHTNAWHSVPSGTNIVVSTTQPTGPSVGDGWVDDDDKFSVWDGNAWREVSASGSGNAPGTIIMWPSTTLPPGYLICDGSTFDENANPELYKALGNSNTLPDLRGKFIRAYNPGGTAVLSTHDWTTGKPRNNFTGTTNNTGAHSHGIRTRQGHSGDGHNTRDYMGGYNSGSNWSSVPVSSGGVYNGPTASAGNHSHSVTINGGGDAETAPDHIILLFCIKDDSDYSVPMSPPGPAVFHTGTPTAAVAPGQLAVNTGTSTPTLTHVSDANLNWIAISASGAPTGSVMMWASDVPPAGWQLMDGSPAATPALANIVGPNVPDMRGRFVKGYDPNGSAIMSKHEDTTRRPRNTAFTGTAHTTGNHAHDIGFRAKDVDASWSGSGDILVSDSAPGSWRTRNKRTGSAGNHSHNVTINGGGDPETAPKHVILAYIIKT